MRVIAGEFKGRKLQSLKGDNTRPTSDKIKGSIFNMIGPYFDGGVCLDLYSGSGNLAVESVSRGMDKAYCFDIFFPAVKVIEENVAMTKQPDSFIVKKLDASKALHFLSKQGVLCDYVFLDPPYAKEELEKNMMDLQSLNLLKKQAKIICEMDKHVILPDIIGQLVLQREQQYGVTKVRIYQLKEGKDD
ncbi:MULTISPECIES: 16S rRNA (guanine(966)-N(2))-methyltransferase RsmD [Enterococcaceae]|uniref:16S rRNA (guanine(966)-N(2))-methyltransferase RsmD n=1 Tax=Enterococcaceae TaxID=81852 RepID=UPI000E506E83|nr:MULTISPECIES: 16S rRNA (guanine(966)-N(2))-methyltransferase RsmD [Enterococcaceae]MCI0130153.1 16S rRNA (guanine(966)-N(2))-methyltransferase RsmD [Vagococcus sp. CY53-2]RGI31016.1 16S rRNA (guanine(966)-N(2))-methyltransferase RsmD [Melissococcus sp. OM08-11BH]UNM88977.1 16S rRNA (guanine(966)-N(2))-methyltransferase RsmD [Vagococcus sp. CY52-2]